MNEVENTVRSLRRRNLVLMNAFIFAVGVAAIAFSVPLEDDTVLKGVLLSLGASIVASSIIAFLSLTYIIREEDAVETTRRWGIVQIYETRQEANVALAEDLDRLSNQLDIIAFGLRSFRDHQGRRIVDKVRRGLKVRILTIDPHSSFLRQRELDEKRNPGDVQSSIQDLREWMDYLRSQAPDPLNVQLRFYDALPLQYYFRQEGRILVGPYLYGKHSQQTITYEFESGSIGFEYWSVRFEEVWDDPRLTYDEPKRPDAKVT